MIPSQPTPPTPNQLIGPSFFDDPKLENRAKFWLSDTVHKRKLSTVILIEGELFKKSSNSEFLKNRYFVMYEDRLAYHNNAKEKKEKGYIFLDLLRVEVHKSKDDEKVGFRLISNRKTEEIYCSNTATFDKWHKVLRDRSVFRDFNSNYTITKAIGKGSFAIVYQATRNSVERKDYAIKSFDKRKMEANLKNKLGLLAEINIMRNLNDHANIIKLYEVYETDNHINLVLELLHGGELFDKILQKGFYTEKDAMMLMRRLLGALAYMHSKRMMHRDLKPENLILATVGDDTDIKIADFGLSTFIDLEEQLFKRCGTPGYVAPEVLADQPYDDRVDVYSAGLILYILLTGCSPFFGESYNEILRKNKKGEVSFNFDGFEHKPSALATSLLKAMLSKDPEKRIRSADALQHEWFTTSGVPSVVPLEALQKYQAEKKTAADKAKKKAAAIAEDLVTMSPVINGRNEEIEEEKGKTFMDSPSMRPGGKETVDMRKMAILKNAQAHAYMAEMAGMKSPQPNMTRHSPGPGGEEGKSARSNPTTPMTMADSKGELKQVQIREGEKKSSFARNTGDVSGVKNMLKKLDG